MHERFALDGSHSAIEQLRNGWKSCSGRGPKSENILLDESEEGTRLRQIDPFCGILTPKERWEIYREAARSEAG